jgi:hypothetical protein
MVAYTTSSVPIYNYLESLVIFNKDSSYVCTIYIYNINRLTPLQALHHTNNEFKITFLRVWFKLTTVWVYRCILR